MLPHLDVEHPADTPAQEAHSPRPVRVTVVEAEACHFCDAAHDTIRTVAQDLPLDVTFIPSRSERGLALVQQHRAAMAPLVLIEDHFVSSGRLKENVLRKRIAEAIAARTVV